MKKFLPLVFLVSPSPAFATTVQNFDSAANAIQHPEGRQTLTEQMAGAIPVKGFGEPSQGLSEKQWIAWVVPNKDPDNLILIGAKSWGRDGKHTGIACFADNKADAGQAKKYADNTCPENYSNGCANKLYLGVLSWRNPQLMLIARSEKPLNQLSGWNKAAEKEGDDESVRPLAYYTKLDSIPYRIASDTLTLGMRGGYSDAYSGGGASYGVLELYTTEDSKVINMSSDLVYHYSDTAGDWNKDGIRQHDINESKYILKMRSVKTHGSYDLECVSLQDRSNQIFH